MARKCITFPIAHSHEQYPDFEYIKFVKKKLQKKHACRNKRKNLIRRAFFRGNMNSLTIQVKQNNIKEASSIMYKVSFWSGTYLGVAATWEPDQLEPLILKVEPH